MVQTVGPAGADDGHLVDVLGDVGIPIRDPGSALPVLLEGALGGEQRVVAGPHGGDGLSERGWHGLSSQLGQLRLGVEDIDVTGAAFHEQPDYGLGFGLVVRFFGRKRVNHGGSGQKAVLLQHVRQRDAGQATTGALEKLPARRNLPMMSQSVVHIAPLVKQKTQAGMPVVQGLVQIYKLVRIQQRMAEIYQRRGLRLFYALR